MRIANHFLELAAKTFVMRMLFMPSPMLLTDLDTWVQPDSKRFAVGLIALNAGWNK